MERFEVLLSFRDVSVWTAVVAVNNSDFSRLL